MKKLKIEITPLITGHFRLDMGNMFGVSAPAVRASRRKNEKIRRYIRIDRQQRLHMVTRSLIVRTPDGIFIVEPGLGSKPNEYAEEYCEPIRTSWGEMLEPHGLVPGDISGVFSSHLHWDHAGGNTEIIDGEVVPTFPNADYFLHEAELRIANDINLQRLPLSYDNRDIPPKKQIKKCAGGILTMVGNYFGVELTGGHTRGHCVIHIYEDSFFGKGKENLFLGDVSPFQFHLKDVGGYELAYDDEAHRLLEEKRRIIERAKKNNLRLWFVHDPKVEFVDGKAI